MRALFRTNRTPITDHGSPITAARPPSPFRRWWLARHPRADTWTLTQGNIYILPTKAGIVYAGTLVVMLLASINYQLNLGYVLTFLLAGSGIMSMHLTHRTLRGLTLHLRSPAPVFAGEPAPLEVVIASAGRRSHGIGLTTRDEATGRALVSPVWIDVPAQGQTSAQLSFVPGRRGWHPVPMLMAETRYPFGLFRAWTLWRPSARVLAWPAPEKPPAPLPPARAIGGDAAQRRAGDGGELEGLRAYQRGDPMRRIVWKKAARTGELVTRDMRVATQHELWLDLAAARLPDPEATLSRLAGWVLAADAAGIALGLRLPGVELPPALGEAQRRAALSALAEWGAAT